MTNPAPAAARPPATHQRAPYRSSLADRDPTDSQASCGQEVFRGPTVRSLGLVEHGALRLQGELAPGDRLPASPQFMLEDTMTAVELEIHRIVQRWLREGYAALTAAQRRTVEALMAVC